MNSLKNLRVFVYPVGPEDRTEAPLRETFSVPRISFTEDGISVALLPVYPG